MLKRRSNTQSVSWFVDQFKFGRLDLDPPYQRKSVWNIEYKQFFIDSVINNFPCPTIFINSETKPDGTTLYHVIDGKQRLTTILDFIRDEFRCSRKSNPVFADKYFSELQDEVKTDFYDYTFTVENISGGTPELLTEAFDRLNRNVAKLTDQELRHAKYSGRFITLMEMLAGDPIWRDIGIATPANIRRMRDVEFLSEIFLLTMHGVLDGKADVLDLYYADYDEVIPDEEKHRKSYEDCKNAILALDLDIRETRFSNYADFYSLWAAFLSVEDLTRIDYKQTSLNLLQLLSDINLAHEAQPEAPTTAFEYLTAARQGSNKASNRRIRATLIRECIVKYEDNT